MANNLTLSVTLTGDGRQLTGTLRNAQGEVQAFGGSTVREGDRAERSLANVERRAGTVGRELQVLTRLAAPLGAAFAGMFAGRAIQSQIDYADRLQKTNLRIGASVEALSQYNHVAGLSGVAFEQLTTGWQRQTRRISEAAQGYGTATDALDTLGLSAEALNQLAPEEQFERIAEALQGVESQADRTALAMKLWDTEGVGLLQIVNQGTDAIRAMREEADRLGLTISQDTADAMANYNDEMARFQAVATGVTRQVASELVPAMTTGLQTASEWLDQMGGAAEILDTVKDAGTGVAVVMAGRYVGAIATSQAALAAKTAVVATTTGAINLLTGATTRQAAAATAMAGATRVATGALALIGGPAGAAVIAAGAIYYFREELGLTQRASKTTEEFLGDLREGMGDLDEAAIGNRLDVLVHDLIEVSLQAQETFAQLERLREAPRMYGQGMAADQRVLEQQTEQRLEEQRNKINALTQAIQEHRDRRNELTSTSRDNVAVLEDMTVTAQRLAEAETATAAATNELTRATNAQADALEDLRNRLRPGRREVVQLADDMRTLTLAIATGTGNVAENIQMIGLLQQRYIEAQNDTNDLAAKTVDAAFTMEGAFDELRLNGLRRLDDGFADLWLGAVDGSRNATDTIKRMWDQTLAELLHMAITRPITVQLAASMGLGGGGQQAGSGSQSFGGIPSFSSIIDGSGAIANAFRAFQGTGSTYAGTFGSELAVQTEGGLRAGFDSFAASGLGNAALGIGGGLAGGYVGTELGSSVFGKTANSNYGAMGGAAIGQALIPIPGLGAAIGGALGGFLDSAFGSGNTQPEFRYQQDGRAPSAYDFGGRESAFGSFGFEQQRLGEDGRAALDEFASGLQAADNALAKYMTDGQIAAASAALDAFTYSGLSNADLLADRLDVLLNASGMQGDLYDRMRNDYQGDDAAKRYESALNIAALEAALESVPDNVLTHVEARLANSDVAVGELTQSLSIQIQQWQTLRGQLELISPTFDSLAIGAVDVTNALVDAAGGLENLQGLYSSYYQNFFTEEERQARLQEQLTEQFAALNMELPGSRAEFRSLVESLDVTTASGRDAQLSLMGLSSSFAQMTAASQQAAASQNAAALSYSSIVGIDGAISDYNTSVSLAQDLAQRRKAQLQDEMRAVDQLSGLIDSLMLSNQSILDPMERLNEAQRQYAQLEIRAQAGDTQAAGQLQGASTAYLDAAAAVYGQSSSQYAMIFNEVTASVRSLEDQYGDSLATLGSIESIERQLLREQRRARDTLTRTLSEQIQANAELSSLGGLLELLPNHLANALSGILGQAVTPNGNTYIPGGFDAEGDALLTGSRGGVADAFRDVLGRDPDDSGLAYYEGEYSSGRMSLDEIRRRLQDSDEANNRFATGAAFTNSIVQRPTMFDIGLMGEAGPEAIMPLTNIGGKLGVRAELPMPNLPPMPFSNMGSNQATAAPAINLEPLLRKIDTLTAEVAQLRGERADDAERAARQRQAQLREQERARGRAKKGVKTV
ncbi:hypothetical protein [Halomonas sp. 15WGF]|uniref:hypothetical protein n=1 Tax=Halomonas sp. 15WGF TaxID=2570357 RepID=UPI0010BEB0BF|nr:hypothetical protein [Halomonas sp. 15WGF]TKJ11107.1 hypothetical protein E8Q34_07255 [Halomonas sp. 15WGF]